MMTSEEAIKLLKEYGISTLQDVNSTYSLKSESNARELLDLLTNALMECSFDINCHDKDIERLLTSTVSAYKDKLLHYCLDTSRGDLVYGITENIDRALKTITGKDSDYQDIQASKINWYNVAIQEGIQNAQFSPDESRDVARWSVFYHAQSVIAGNYSIVSRLQQQRYDSFISNLGESKYTPIRALLEDDASPKLNREYGLSALDKRKSFAVRLGCKFGIHFVTKIAGGKIHYLLDDIDLFKVFNKEPLKPGGSLPIITSELRFLYKHWVKYQDSVIFYKLGKQVPAPWSESQEQWKTITSIKAMPVTSFTKKPVFLSLAALAAANKKSCFGDDTTASDNPSPEFGGYCGTSACTPPLGPGRHSV